MQKILIPLAIIGGAGIAYRTYGWPGVVVVASVVVFGILLHFSRMMQVLKRAANRPIGYVDSAVMLNAKIKPGATLLHVVAMTRSLGLLKSAKGEMRDFLLGADNEGTVDSSHPTDLGFFRQADAFEQVLRPILFREQP